LQFGACVAVQHGFVVESGRTVEVVEVKPKIDALAVDVEVLSIETTTKPSLYERNEARRGNFRGC
jgi:hypothetical protein